MAEFRTWSGEPCGYEGFLSQNYASQTVLYTGYYGIGFGPDGFYLEPWSPLKGKPVKVRGVQFMGRSVDAIE